MGCAHVVLLVMVCCGCMHFPTAWVECTLFITCCQSVSINTLYQAM